MDLLSDRSGSTNILGPDNDDDNTVQVKDRSS